jgi:hypothetical protein
VRSPQLQTMPFSTILARVVARTGVAIWRHRFACLAAAIAVAALGADQLVSAGPTTINGDCADATMAAVTTTSDDVAHAAYACLSSDLHGTPEDAWIAGMRRSAAPRGQFSRVADTRTSDGGQMVFYAVESRGQSIGYIVYLASDGRVRGVE